MNGSVLSGIEEGLSRLSLDDQLWLLERLVQNIRQHFREIYMVDNQFVALAISLEIHRELQAITQEFACVEADGLEIL